MNDKCRFCQNELNSNAVFCTQCDHFQNWRRFIAFGTSTLSLIIAMISVSAVLFSSLKDEFYQAKIHITGNSKTLRIINLSIKPIVVNDRWQVDISGNDKTSVMGKFVGETFVVKPMSEAVYKMEAKFVTHQKNNTKITKDVILNTFEIHDQEINAARCNLYVTYDIEGTISKAPGIPCRAEINEIPR